MDSEISETQTQKKTQKSSFSIESIIGANATETRKSPEIDIENNESRLSEEEDNENNINRMRYYFNTPFLQNGANFPFLLGYEPWLPRLTRMLGSAVPYPEVNQEIGSRIEESDPKREHSPVSVGSELDSDGGDDNGQGL